MERWQIALTLLTAWLLAAGLSAIYLTGGYIRLYDDPNDALGVTHFCRSFMTRHEITVHAVVVFLFQLFIPLLAMSVLYTLIGVELRRVARCHLFQQNERDVQLR